MTGPSIFPYLKNLLLRSFEKKLIKYYFTGIIPTMLSFLSKTEHSEKNYQIREAETSDNKSDQTMSCQTSSYDENIAHI